MKIQQIKICGMKLKILTKKFVPSKTYTRIGEDDIIKMTILIIKMTN